MPKNRRRQIYTDFDSPSHLLRLREYQGIQIVRPMDFLRMVGV